MSKVVIKKSSITKLFNIPYIGYVFRIIVTVLNFPVIMKNIEDLYYYTHSQIDRLDSEINMFKNQNKSTTIVDKTNAYHNSFRISHLESEVKRLKEQIDIKQIEKIIIELGANILQETEAIIDKKLLKR
jgi:hypothetical protein